MPKAKVRARGSKASSARSGRRKFRIGNAKGGKAAHLMSTDALKEVLNDVNKSNYHQNARSVLQLRGVPIVWPGQLAEQETLADLAQDMRADSPA